MEELITVLIFVFFVLIIMSILGNKRVEKKKNKNLFLKKQFEDVKKVHKKYKVKKLLEQRSVRNIQRKNKEAENNIKANGYLEDRSVIHIFDFIRNLVCFFKPNKVLSSKGLTKDLMLKKKKEF